MSKVIFIFILFLSIIKFAQSATLTPFDSNKNVIEEGKIFETHLQLEGEEDLALVDFDQITKDQFNEYFYFLDGEKIKEKEFRLRLILKKFYQTGEITKVKFGIKEINCRLTGFQITTPKELPKDFIIQDQKEGWKRFFTTTILWTIFGVLIVVSYPLFQVIRKIYQRKRKAKELASKKDFWKNYFLKADERSQFEEIGKCRKEWLQLLKNETPEIQTYFKILDEYQYKKDLEPNELQELKSTLNGMKDVFDRCGI